MGRVFSSLGRELKNFDVENRAFKVISQDAPRPAPKYSATKTEIETLKKEHGITAEELAKKDDKLNENLKNVYVVSEGDSPSIQSSKQLPFDRATDRTEMQYGYIEPETIPVGNITLKKTLELLSSHNDDPSNWTPNKLASHYKLDIKFVEQLIDRYRVFELHIPEKANEKDKRKTWQSQIELQMAIKNIHSLALVKEQNKAKKDSSSVEFEGVKPT